MYVRRQIIFVAKVGNTVFTGVASVALSRHNGIHVLHSSAASQMSGDVIHVN